MKKWLLGAVLILSINVSASLACVCVSLDVPLADELKSAFKNADSIFLGKVKRFDFIKGVPNEYLESRRETVPGLTWETKTAVFDVDSYWKGTDDPEISIVMDTTRNSDGSGSSSSCEYSFEEGKTYLVFARKQGEFLRNIACSFTRRDDQIEEIMPLLGEGKRPVKPKP
jgi:hypothetical protein